MNLVIIGTAKYLSSMWNLPNTWANDDFNWTLTNKLQGNLNQHLNISIQENAFASVVCKILFFFCSSLNVLLKSNVGFSVSQYLIISVKNLNLLLPFCTRTWVHSRACFMIHKYPRKIWICKMYTH